MLVLTRKEGESLRIGDDISLYVLTLHKDDGRVKIGIDAPLDVKILRGEIIERRNKRRRRGDGEEEHQDSDRGGPVSAVQE